MTRREFFERLAAVPLVARVFMRTHHVDVVEITSEFVNVTERTDTWERFAPTGRVVVHYRDRVNGETSIEIINTHDRPFWFQELRLRPFGPVTISGRWG